MEDVRQFQVTPNERTPPVDVLIPTCGRKPGLAFVLTSLLGQTFADFNNVIYDRAKLLNVGGFQFWPRLPREHAGEEVVVQWLLIRRYGGCGILPCGTYHFCLPTKVPDRTHNTIEHFAELLAESEGTAGGPLPPPRPATVAAATGD